MMLSERIRKGEGYNWDKNDPRRRVLVKYADEVAEFEELILKHTWLLLALQDAGLIHDVTITMQRHIGGTYGISAIEAVNEILPHAMGKPTTEQMAKLADIKAEQHYKEE